MSPVTGDLGPAAVTAGHLMSSLSFRKQLSVTKHLYSNLLPLKVKKTNILEDKLLKRVLQNHYAVYLHCRIHLLNMNQHSLPNEAKPSLGR